MTTDRPRDTRFTIDVLPDVLAVGRSPDGAAFPAEIDGAGGLLAFIRSPGETTIIARESLLPGHIRAERGFRALRVRGPLPFTLTGVIASLTTVLAEAGVPVFVLSTFDTDLILVPGAKLADAISALREAGHECLGH